MEILILFGVVFLLFGLLQIIKPEALWGLYKFRMKASGITNLEMTSEYLLMQRVGGVLVLGMSVILFSFGFNALGESQKRSEELKKEQFIKSSLTISQKENTLTFKNTSNQKASFELKDCIDSDSTSTFVGKVMKLSSFSFDLNSDEAVTKTFTSAEPSNYFATCTDGNGKSRDCSKEIRILKCESYNFSSDKEKLQKSNFSFTIN